MIIVFFITGLWHGASWNFIFWGLFHGFFLIVERIGLSKFLNKAQNFVGHIYVALVVLVGWVFFRAENLSDAWQYLKGMFAFRTGGNEIVYQYFSFYFLFVFILAMILSTNIKVYLKVKWALLNRAQEFKYILYPIYLLLFFLSLLELAESNYNPFIYFRF